MLKAALRHDAERVADVSDDQSTNPVRSGRIFRVILDDVLRRILLTLVLLTLPARAHDITGTWEFNVQLDAGSGTPSFVFKQSGEKLTGTYTGLMGTAEVTGSVKGDDIEFSFEASVQDQKAKVVYKGKVESATRMKGDVDYAGLGKGTWTATKK